MIPFFFISHSLTCDPSADQSRGVNDEVWLVWLNRRTNFTQQAFIEGKITAGLVFKPTFIKHLPGSWRYYNYFTCVISLGSHNSMKWGPPPHLQMKKEANRYNCLSMVTLPGRTEGGIQSQTLTTESVFLTTMLLWFLAMDGSKDLDKYQST